jgi:hypothetical protein
MNSHRANQVSWFESEISKGYITFSLPMNSHRANQVSWFESEISWARERYGDDIVRVVDMANITMPEQVDLVRNSALFLTNHGGGGVVSLFLSRHTGILVFWNEDRRFDHNFYESAGYFRTTWVSKEERVFVNRTVALMEQEIERTARSWPDNISARRQKRRVS